MRDVIQICIWKFWMENRNHHRWGPRKLSNFKFFVVFPRPTNFVTVKSSSARSKIPKKIGRKPRPRPDYYTFHDPKGLQQIVWQLTRVDLNVRQRWRKRVYVISDVRIISVSCPMYEVGSLEVGERQLYFSLFLFSGVLQKKPSLIL